MALYWCKNPPQRSTIFNNLDKLFISNRATIQDNDNVTPSKVGSNSDFLISKTPILVLSPLVLINFQLFIKTFIKMAKN